MVVTEVGYILVGDVTCPTDGHLAVALYRYTAVAEVGDILVLSGRPDTAVKLRWRRARHAVAVTRRALCHTCQVSQP